MEGNELNSKIRALLNSALMGINDADYDSALASLKASEALDPQNPEALYNLGVTYCRMGLFHTAISYFEKLLNLPFTSVDVLSTIKLLAFSLIRIADYSLALERIETGRRMSPDDTTLLSVEGYCLEKTERMSEALRTYRLILDIDPVNANAMNSIAWLLTESGGNLDEAMVLASKALRIRPESPAYLDTMGCILLRKGDTASAARFLRKALDLQPDSEEIRSHLEELFRDNA